MSENTTAALVGDNGSADAGAAPIDAGALAAAPANEQSFASGFDEDTAAYIQNKGWKSNADLLESYRNLEKFSGGSKNILELPGDDASEEAMADFYNRLGRPETPDQYNFELPEDADQELVDWFRETAHKHGLTSAQATQLFNDWNDMSIQRIGGLEDQLRQNAEADISTLKKEWGRNYDANLEAGRRAVGALGYDEQALSGLEEKMGTAEMLKLFSSIGAKMGEDAFVSGESDGSGFGTSPAQARVQISDLKNDKAFMDRYLSGDKDAVSKMSRLMGLAHGG